MICDTSPSTRSRFVVCFQACRHGRSNLGRRLSADSDVVGGNAKYCGKTGYIESNSCDYEQ